ncbi:regulator of chromosome condensation, RCC1 [Carpediemonas membranifera]|uniref:Regulator of chromosome condensation, RCC1 n=1 Tax=Carpediemonas membranifera TaxID=201153 RepID=A0A8J6AQJ7_9EUKA|nr:regulator of chromosome condensation, RCC1 [Carpediemonas membranifera]|eukprot:KAG9391501.1 regulator of chromosome condensation, RCC1 [Carpediemonas membranifera]
MANGCDVCPPSLTAGIRGRRVVTVRIWQPPNRALGAMSCADTSPSGIRDALISAFRSSLTATASVSGDIPSLLQHAYSRHFNAQMPSIHDIETTSVTISAASLESLLTMLSEIPPLAPTAQVFLDRARSILTSGPPLSMNVELADGEELPVALHTLNQGAVWACLMGGGANPDLEDRVLKEAREKQLYNTELHDKICNAFIPEAKCLWFLCRKFFFTLNVAEKDGESYIYKYLFYHHRMYMGRLFMLDTDKQPALTRAWMPRALEVYSSGFTHIARTPKGLWGWGDNRSNQLGFESAAGGVDPTRLTFAACPKVAELEASLPPWEKHRMVTHLSMKEDQTFILTPVGTVMSGQRAEWFRGHVAENRRGLFHPVVVPAGFVPDHIIHGLGVIILSMGDRQVISGRNDFGQLGIGHENDTAGFVDIPFRVDRIVTHYFFNIVHCGRQLLFAGGVRRHIAQSGLLPGYRQNDRCLTPSPLRFPESVEGFFCDDYEMVWVAEGDTHYCNENKTLTIAQIEATALRVPRIFRDSAGQWFMAVGESGVAKMVECEPPSWWHDIMPVDVDTWTQPS